VVKGNQERLQEDILESFAQADAVCYQGVDHDEYETEDDGHGRVEKRSYAVLYDLTKIRDKDEWPGLAVIGLCYSERTVKGETASEVRLFIGSKKEGAKFYGDGLRNHWGIEMPQSDHPQSAGLCATGGSGYHRPRCTSGAGRVVRAAPWSRRLPMSADEPVLAPPRA
jgi:hypothetical protein